MSSFLFHTRTRPERENNQGRYYADGGDGYGARGRRPTERDSHAYEPYDVEENAERVPRFRRRQDDPRGSNRSRGSRRSRNSAAEEEAARLGGGKETVIDDPGTGMTTDDDEDLKKPLDSDDTEKAELHRYSLICLALLDYFPSDFICTEGICVAALAVPVLTPV